MAVVVVLSPKGGAGTTTVATNLAVGLARRDPGQVALVDLDVAFGDVASALLLDPRRTILDAIAGEPLADVLVGHPSGLQVLLAPEDEIPDPETTAPAIPALLGQLDRGFRTVVVDTGAGLDAVTLAAVAAATELVLVGAMDVATLLDLRKVLRRLDAAGSTAPRHLVLNRADQRLGLELADVEGTTGLPVAIAVPLDHGVARTLNEGRQVVGDTHGGEAAAAFEQLVERFVTGEQPLAPARKRRPWLATRAARP